MRFALLSALLIVRTAQQTGKDPIHDVCRRHKHQTCIIDSKLYIDGGLAYYGGSKGNDSIAERNTYLLWEDVSNATTVASNFPEQHANLSKDTDVPSVSGGVLWPDNVNKLFYLFGGEYSDTSEVKRRDAQRFTLWFYDTIYDTWNKSKYHGSQDAVRWPALGAGAVSDAGIAYYYGGYLTNTSDFATDGQPVMQNALISYDMDKRQWENQTLDEVPRAEGSLQYIPASEGGMLVYFGGLETDKTTGEVSYSNMSQIRLFDIANPRWYTQTATGDVPLSRRGFCTGVVWAKDKSSYNIYLFGGFGGPNGTGLGDIYVLSLPSFQWILIWPTPQKTVFPRGKGWSSCNVFRNSQMIIIGGYLTNTSIPDCDVPSIGGQHGLLLGQESVEQGTNGESAWWHAPMDNVTEYRVPDQIVARIGGDADGNAASKAPAMGWEAQDLAKYLGTPFTAQPRSATRAIPTNTPTDQLTPSSHSTKKKNIGAIVGGTVGGAIVLTGIIALVFFCLRSRRCKQDIQEDRPSETIGASNLHSSDMAQKSVATSSVLPESTMHSPVPQPPTYSTHGSPSPVASPWHGEMHMENSYYQGSSNSHPQSGDWAQHDNYASQGNYPYQQTYYPPPPESSQSNKEGYAHTMSVELPNIRSPVNAAVEMPQANTPLPDHGNRVK